MSKYLLIAIVLFLICSCKKATVVPATYFANDYMPMTVGSTWKYLISNIDAPSVFIDSVTLTMTADHFNAYGKSFAVVTADKPAFNGRDKFYFYKSDAQFKLYSGIFYDDLSSDQWELPIFNDSRFLQGDTTYVVPNSNSSLPPTYEISGALFQKGIDEVIAGITYHNVATTGVDILKLYDGTDPSHVGNYYLYQHKTFAFAPNIGLIGEISDNQVLSLVSYNIKPKL